MIVSSIVYIWYIYIYEKKILIFFEFILFFIFFNFFHFLICMACEFFFRIILFKSKSSFSAISEVDLKKKLFKKDIQLFTSFRKCEPDEIQNRFVKKCLLKFKNKYLFLRQIHQPKHLLWSQYFVKQYDAEYIRKASQVDEKPKRKWTWIFVLLVSD